MITRSRRVALLLFDEVELLDFAGVLQALTLAGRHWNWRPFKIHALSARPGAILTCNQLRVEAPLGLDGCSDPEIVIVPGGYGALLAARDPEVMAWLTRACEQAAACCCLGNGAALIAATGLFAGDAVSVTPAVAATLDGQGSTLQSNTVERLIAGERLLSARSSEASFDLGLQLVERFLGASLRKKVMADQLLASAQPAAVELLGLEGDVSDSSQS